VYDILLTHATVMTMDGIASVIDDGFVAIKDGKIGTLGPAAQAPADAADTAIDCRGCLVLPGLINSHTHLAMSYFRGIADDLNLDDWLTKHIFPAEAKYLNPEFVYSASLLGLAESFKCGVTCINDMYLFAADVARACQDAGMRAFVGEGVTKFPTPSAPTWKDGVKLTQRLLEQFTGDGLVTATVCPHAPYTCTPEILLELHGLAVEQDALYHIHLHETAGEPDKIDWADAEDSPTHTLMHLGVLGPKAIAAHCVWVDDHDLGHMREGGCSVAHCPTSNLKLGSGIAPVHSMVEAGVSVGVGTDGAASNNNLNIWEEIHLAALLAKGVYKDASVVPATSALGFATCEGARALWAESFGSIETGKLADLIVVELDGLHMTPLYPHPGALESELVYAAQARQVRDTIVNGKVVMRNRELKTLDEEKLAADAQAWVDANFR